MNLPEYKHHHPHGLSLLDEYFLQLVQRRLLHLREFSHLPDRVVILELDLTAQVTINLLPECSSESILSQFAAPTRLF